MEYKLTETQLQYLKGLMTVELPIFVQGKTKEDIEFVAEVMYPLMTTHKHLLVLEFLVEHYKITERLQEALNNPNDKIIFTNYELPIELESQLSEYILIMVKSNEQGNMTISSRVKTQDFSMPTLIKLKHSHPRLQAPQYTGTEKYEYLVYDDRDKLKKKTLVTINTLPELEQAVEFITSRKSMKKSYGTMLGREFKYDSTIIFEVKIDDIFASREVISNHLEDMRKIAVYTDVFIVALVTV